MSLKVSEKGGLSGCAPAGKKYRRWKHLGARGD
jgi:hypothetical protein